MKTIFHPHGFDGQRTNLRPLTAALLLGAALTGWADAGKLVIRGSNTFGEELAPQLANEYKKEHNDVTFDLEFKGTTYGFGALATRNCNIAAASRPITTNETALIKSFDVELTDHVIGEYSVAVVVNANNPVGNLTPAQVRDLFTGAVTNWKAVGGPDAPVHTAIRNLISGTYLGFQELAMDRKAYAADAKSFPSYAAINAAVAQDPNAIGYCSFDLMKQAGVKAVSIGGVAPGATAVNSGAYPYTRMLRLYTVKDDTASAAEDFVAFVESKRGQEVLTRAGFVPHP
ncbi:MAG: phosphate ABC transporter substrate-binding protein [Verrucomicrobia bacterium]|nr:phosphate ABC transporter substrate-binding protein [Verrucomicrobiota bacterium]